MTQSIKLTDDGEDAVVAPLDLRLHSEQVHGGEAEARELQRLLQSLPAQQPLVVHQLRELEFRQTQPPAAADLLPALAHWNRM